MKYRQGLTKICGVAVPLSALKSEQGSACGEFPDLIALGKLAAQWGFRLVQLLPVNDTGEQSSPYSALSAFAIHPIYIRIRDLPELTSLKAATIAAATESRAFDVEMAGKQRVDFSAIYFRKIEILREIWEGGACASTEKDIQIWAAAHPWLIPYACFKELKRRNGGKAWWEWSQHRDPSPDFILSFWDAPESAADCRFWAWLQMRAEAQFLDAARSLADQGIELLGDIPILMNADSVDVWQRRRLFHTDYAAGAPPDMYAPMGQNWGFPLYNWQAHIDEDFAFWKERLKAADLFYSAYRIDHVLGFFRIWALSSQEADGFLGRFVPELPLSWPDLAALHFSPDRIRWLSKPHIEYKDIVAALSAGGFSTDTSRPDSVAAALFSRIGDEELFLFKEGIEASSSIDFIVYDWAAQCGLLPQRADAVAALCNTFRQWWHNRCLYEYEQGHFVPSWTYKDSKAWHSLSETEKASLDALIVLRRGESMLLWEKSGRAILKALVSSVPMQACAEDLGAVPPCVPKVLTELDIPGLRVLRWHRAYDKDGAPFVPFDDYPEASIACPSVHDSSSLRQWWEEEAPRDLVWPLVLDALQSEADAEAHPVPASLDPQSAALLLQAFARVASRIISLPIQDILAMSPALREADPAQERINVPGTSNTINWSYRMKPTLEAVAADKALTEKVKSVVACRIARANS